MAKGRNNSGRTRKVKQIQGEPRVINPKHEEYRQVKPIVAKNDFQKEVLKALNTKQVVVIMASAGCGKSYLTMGTASDWLVKGQIDQIVLTRPAVGMGKSLGLLPGSMIEKYSPYLMPLIEVFKDRHGKGRYDTALSSGNLEFLPIEYARGRNLSGVTILDEAQNVEKNELFSMITRVTESGRLWIIGDPAQHDLRGESGIVWLKQFVERHNLHDHIAVIEADSDQIVRGELCKAFVKAMERDIK